MWKKKEEKRSILWERRLESTQWIKRKDNDRPRGFALATRENRTILLLLRSQTKTETVNGKSYVYYIL